MTQQQVGPIQPSVFNMPSPIYQQPYQPQLVEIKEKCVKELNVSFSTGGVMEPYAGSLQDKDHWQVQYTNKAGTFIAKFSGIRSKLLSFSVNESISDSLLHSIELAVKDLIKLHYGTELLPVTFFR